MLVGALCLASLGLIYGLLAPKSYQATTTLVVENRRPRAPTDQSPDTGESGYVDTQVATLQSDVILNPVIETLRLTEDPEFNRRRSLLPFGQAEPIPQLRQQYALENLRRALSAARTGTSYVVELRARSRDRAKAAALANAVANQFVEDQRAFAAKVTERSTGVTTVRVIGPAAPPLDPAGPGSVLLALGGLIVGAGLGAGVRLFQEIVGDRLHSAQLVAALADFDPLLRVQRVGLRTWRRGKPDNHRALSEALHPLLYVLTVRRPNNAMTTIGFCSVGAPEETALACEAFRGLMSPGWQVEDLGEVSVAPANADRVGLCVLVMRQGVAREKAQWAARVLHSHPLAAIFFED